MNAAKLRACPFCGGKAEIKYTFQRNFEASYWAECTECKARTKEEQWGTWAAEAWNQRAGEKIKDAEAAKKAEEEPEPARWLHRKRNGYAVLVCSNCGKEKEGYTRTAYCPTCGRPMDREEAQG